MPRKTIDNQRYAYGGSRKRSYSQWPKPTAWGRRGNGRLNDLAMDRWVAKRRECVCDYCLGWSRLKGIRSLYRRRH